MRVRGIVAWVRMAAVASLVAGLARVAAIQPAGNAALHGDGDSSGGAEHAGGDGGAKARRAHDSHWTIRWHLRAAPRQVRHMDVLGAGDMPFAPLFFPAHV